MHSPVMSVNGTYNHSTTTASLDVAIVVIYAVIFTVGICGNFLVIATIAWSRHLQTAVNAYLVNLCVADLLLLLICMPTAVVDIFAQTVWYFGPVMCRYILGYPVVIPLAASTPGTIS